MFVDISLFSQHILLRHSHQSHPPRPCPLPSTLSSARRVRASSTSPIAKRAIERKTGARGLRSIMEDILLDTMFDLPGTENAQEVVVNDEAVTSDAAPLTIYADQKESASAG